jgi:hypothetical protein
MASTFRLYGPEIGEATAIVDADVTGVTLDGIIELTPHDTNLSTFAVPPERLASLVEDGLAYDKAEVNTNDPIWAAIEDVENRYANADDDKEEFIDAARTLFEGA